MAKHLSLAAILVCALTAIVAPQPAAHGAEVRAWGNNGNGQLGDGTTTKRYAPVAVTGLSGGVSAVAGGYAHSLAVKDGGVWAWGFNGFGGLGDGTTADERTTPVAVTGLSGGVSAVAGGYAHSLAVKDGGVWAWG